MKLNSQAEFDVAFTFDAMQESAVYDERAAQVLADGIRILRESGTLRWGTDIKTTQEIPRYHYARHEKEYEDGSIVEVTIDQLVQEGTQEEGEESIMILLKTSDELDATHCNLSSYVARVGELAVSRSVQESAAAEGLPVTEQDFTDTYKELPDVPPEDIKEVLSNQSFLVRNGWSVNAEPLINRYRKRSQAFRRLSDIAWQSVLSEALERSVDLRRDGYATENDVYKLVTYLQHMR